MLTPLNLQVSSPKTSGTSTGKSTNEGDGGFGALLNDSRARQSDEAGLPSSSLNTGSGSSDQRPTASADKRQSVGNTAQNQTASLVAGNGMTRSQRQALSETLERLQGNRLEGREHNAGRTQLSTKDTAQVRDAVSRTLADSTVASDGKTLAEALQRTSADNIVDASDNPGKKLATSNSRLTQDASTVTADADRDAVIDEKRLRAAESDDTSDAAGLYGLVDAAALTQQPQVRDGVRGTENASVTRRTGIEQALRGRDPTDTSKAQGERTDSVRGERLFGEALQQKTDQQPGGLATGFDQILSQHNAGAGTSDTAMNTLSALTGQPGQSVTNATTGQAVTTATLPAMDSDQWAPALERQVISLSLRGGGEARLDLNPAELGPLSISLKMGEQSAQMHIASHHAQVRAAIEAALPQLRDAFNANGIELGQTSVSDQGSFQQGGFQQEQERSRDTLAALNGVDSNGIAGQHSGDEIITINAPNGRALNGGIDLFA